MQGLGHVELLLGKTQEARNHFETALSLSKGKKYRSSRCDRGVVNGDFDSKSSEMLHTRKKLQQATGPRVLDAR